MKAATAAWAVLRFPWTLLRWFFRGVGRVLRSVLFWILFVVLLIVVLIAYYAWSDLDTPFTRDAYVQAYVIQVAPQVEGQVVRVAVQENQSVERGDLLFEIDPRPFQHRVRELEAKLAQAVKQVAQLESARVAAQAEDRALSADAAYARAVFEQEEGMYRKGSTTTRKYLDALHRNRSAKALVARSRATVRQREEALAARLGDEHALVAEVRAQLASARLRLSWTRVFAPVRGLVTNLQLQPGSYASAGRPVLTCIDAEQWWIVANFREGCLEYVEAGQPVEVAFKTYPGRIFTASVQSVGWGIGQGQGVPSGELPNVKTAPDWIRLPQRFPVRVQMDDPDAVPLRVGASVSVTIYARDEEVIGPLARFWQRLDAYLNYIR
jgi:multidrug resistance efflux pump